MDYFTGMFIGFYVAGLIGGFFLGFVTHLIIVKKKAVVILPEPDEMRPPQFGRKTSKHRRGK